MCAKFATRSHGLAEDRPVPDRKGDRRPPRRRNLRARAPAFDGGRYGLLARRAMPAHLHVLIRAGRRLSAARRRALLEIVHRQRRQASARPLGAVLVAEILRSVHARRAAVGDDARVHGEQPDRGGAPRKRGRRAFGVGGAGRSLKWRAGGPRHEGLTATRPYKSLAPRAGLEPATIRLTVECSTS